MRLWNLMCICIRKNCKCFSNGLSKVSIPWMNTEFGLIGKFVKPSTHFHDLFAWLPDFLAQEFSNYLVNFPHLLVAEAVSRKGRVTVWNLWCWPQQVTRAEFLTAQDVFEVVANSDRCLQLLVCLTKAVITLLKKGNKHV